MRDVPESDIRQDDEIHADAEFAHKRKSMIFSGERTLYWFKIGLTVFFTVLGGLLVVAYAWHVAGPESYRWISDMNLERLERFSISILSGVVATIAVMYLFKPQG